MSTQASPELARMLENMESRVARNLADAIETMRRSCAQAERIASHEDRDFAICQVMHSLVWGLANAQSSIETAMSARAESAALQLAATVGN